MSLKNKAKLQWNETEDADSDKKQTKNKNFKKILRRNKNSEQPNEAQDMEAGKLKN